MQAVLKSIPGPGIDVTNIEMPVVGPEDVLLKVKAAGICGSDVHIYEWTEQYRWIRLPLVPGHEFAGDVCEVGSAVVGLDIGERVVADPYMPCGRCWNCRVGLFQLCDRDRPSAGVPAPALQFGFRRNGGMAQYVAIPAQNVYVLPGAIRYEIGGILECFAVGLHAVERSEIRPGDSVVILGPGPIGLSIMLAARALGASTVAIVGTSRDADRLCLAQELGADQVIDVEESGAVQKVREITLGLGADAVFDATGNADSAAVAVKLVRTGGELVMVGVSAKPSSVAFDDIVRRELTVKGSYGNLPKTWKRALSLAESKNVPLGRLITHQLPMSDAVHGFELARTKQALKVVLVPD